MSKINEMINFFDEFYEKECTYINVNKETLKKDFKQLDIIFHNWHATRKNNLLKKQGNEPNINYLSFYINQDADNCTNYIYDKFDDFCTEKINELMSDSDILNYDRYCSFKNIFEAINFCTNSKIVEKIIDSNETIQNIITYCKKIEEKMNETTYGTKIIEKEKLEKDIENKESHLHMLDVQIEESTWNGWGMESDLYKESDEILNVYHSLVKDYDKVKEFLVENKHLESEMKDLINDDESLGVSNKNDLSL